MKKCFFMAATMLLIASMGVVYAGGRTDQRRTSPLLIFVNVGSNIPYPAATQRTFEELCVQNGWEHRTLDGQQDITLNVRNIEQAAAMRPDVMIIMQQDATVQANAIRAASRAGIPIIMDTGRPNPDFEDAVNVYCGVDDIMAGRAGAELMNEALGGRGRIVVIQGNPGQQTTEDRIIGFNGRLRELGSQIEILSSNVSNWSKERATAVMADFLTRYSGRIDGVYAHDDESAAGAALAIKEAGIAPGTIKIVGTGGSRTGLQLIDEGEMYGTTYQSPRTTMTMSIEAAKYIINNNVKAAQHLDPFWRWIDLPKVTASNVKQFLPGEW